MRLGTPHYCKEEVCSIFEGVGKLTSAIIWRRRAAERPLDRLARRSRIEEVLNVLEGVSSACEHARDQGHRVNHVRRLMGGAEPKPSQEQAVIRGCYVTTRT
jgi:hypothetical protein